MIYRIFILLISLCLLGTAHAAYSERKPGSPETLTDWRWLARPPQGQRIVDSEMDGKTKYPAADGAFVVFQAEGPGVVDHFMTADGAAVLTFQVDGQTFWSGKLHDAYLQATAKGGKVTPFFSASVMIAGGGMYHLIAPIGYSRTLRILSSKEMLPRYISYRTFPKGTAVLPASANQAGEYGRKLREAGDALQSGVDFTDGVYARIASEQRQEIVLPAQGRVTALRAHGSGEVARLEFHLNPALTGTLREVVAEFYYDGAAEPALRLPLPDLAGTPHPWLIQRWHRYNGTLAAGIRYPWFIHTPRIHFPEDTFLLNFPIPFANGLRIDLVNRSEDMRFTGFTRALVEPLSTREAAAAGRLCGTRLITPLAPGDTPAPLMKIPGPGALVALGLFTTGGGRWPAAINKYIVSLAADGAEPVTGLGIVPLWFRGRYGGAQSSFLWNHPVFGDQYAGCMRNFVTDPVTFQGESVFGFTPGVDGNGAPTQATVIALWYRFGGTPYVAPALPACAETLPYVKFGTHPASKGSQLFWEVEAEDLVPMCLTYGGHVRVVEDIEHDYHPSMGKYLHYVADRAGDYVDCVASFPPSRYFAVGTGTLWGPNRGNFEMDILSREGGKSPPSFPQGDDFYRGRVLGSVPMTAPVFVGQSERFLRDDGTAYPAAFLNPAPDDDGVIRFICQTKPMNSTAYLLALDMLRLDMPPPAPAGWLEFEDGVLPEVSGDLTARLPKYGRFDWSGWGALLLASPQGGKAVIRALAPTGPAAPVTLSLKGCLGPKQGTWQVRVAGVADPFTLTPGKDEKEIVEWKIPVKGLTLPGEITLEFLCIAPGEKEARAVQAPKAELALDAWSIK
ncbi:MAG: hypothetical protein ACYC7E_07050 [Armatimonadota bacterium]